MFMVRATLSRIVAAPGPGHPWYDWFLPETSPDPLQVSQLEEVCSIIGGRGHKCWTGERLVSPLLLCNTHPSTGTGAGSQAGP